MKPNLSLYLLSILKENSNENSPMSLQEIREKLGSTFYTPQGEKVPDIKTIRSNLKSIVDLIDARTFLDPAGETDAELTPVDTVDLGFYIGCCIRSNGGGFEPYTPDSSEETDGVRSPELFFYYRSLFQKNELTLLLDSLEAYNYISAEDITSLVIKLRGLSPKELSDSPNKTYRGDFADDPRVNKRDALLLDNLTILHQAIVEGDFVTFSNCYYNEKHVLVPRGESIRLRPLRLMFNNGYYYLLALQYSRSKDAFVTTHYRVDRLKNVSSFVPSPAQREQYTADVPDDAASYRLHHPAMYGDAEIRAVLHVTNSAFMLNVLADTFGTTARITPVSSGDPEYLEVRVHAAEGGILKFATEYCADVLVRSPETLAEKVQSDLEQSLASYRAQRLTCRTQSGI
ncbi:MAG: WYL domain-containing protein [Lachnospiraceae bacterium]|nr:WYL domain-containing protein [Lachnospiraceae bacterium]